MPNPAPTRHALNSTSSRIAIAAALVGLLTAVPAWLALSQSNVRFSDTDVALVASMSLSQLGPVPPDPSNRVADDPAAAALGEALFSDVRLSRSGAIACASCHIPQRGFDDNDLPGQGVGTTTRRTMPLAGTAYSPWFFWDGRADSQWAQALGPLEHPGEQALDRLGIARVVASAYRQDYEALFGPLLDMEGLPHSASPLGSAADRDAWTVLDAQTQLQVNTIFANVGKAIAAFERTLLPERSRFDDFADALADGKTSNDLTPSEQQGLAVFIGKGQCIQCHNGPLFSDHFFHNTGVPLAKDLPLDLGRSVALEHLDNDPFNCLGAFSDADPGQCGELRFKSTDERLLRAFKTPSLRTVEIRAPFMHAGQFTDLETVVAHYNTAPWSVVGITELHKLQLTAAERSALVDFLKAL